MTYWYRYAPAILIYLLKEFINHLREILYKKNMTKNINIKIKFKKNINKKYTCSWFRTSQNLINFGKTIDPNFVLSRVSRSFSKWLNETKILIRKCGLSFVVVVSLREALAERGCFLPSSSCSWFGNCFRSSVVES